MKVLFLYSEVMAYTLSGLRELVNSYNAEVHIVRWDRKKLTPYTPPELPGINYYLRSAYSDKELLQLINEINPSICYVSGWMDKGYVKAAGILKKKGVPVLAGMDNQWKGSFKQRIGCLLSSFKVKPYFSHILATGIYQYEFARRLGYSRNKILLNAVTADVTLFEKAYRQRKSWNKRILYVGRFNEVKGIELLYEGFTELQDNFKDWQLVLIGNGPLKNQFKETDQIVIKEFMNSDELVKEAEHASVFCLPSRKEPWGVVIHEFAAAGLSLLTSDICGANSEFVKHGYNGYIFESGSKESLKKYLRLLMSEQEAGLALKGHRSNLLAQHLTPESWAANFVSVLN